LNGKTGPALCTVALIMIGRLVLEHLGVFRPFLTVFIADAFPVLAAWWEEAGPAVFLILFIPLIAYQLYVNPPWLPKGYLWSEWDRWEPIGRVREGKFRFSLLGREFRGLNCGVKKVVFLEGDPENYEVSIAKVHRFATVFRRGLEQRVLGLTFKPTDKVYAARRIDNVDDVVRIGWGKERHLYVDEVTGEVVKGERLVDETLPKSAVTKGELLRETISKMKHVIWVVPRWRTTDLKKLAQMEIGFMDVMVNAERRNRELLQLLHTTIDAHRKRIDKSTMVALISMLDTSNIMYQEMDAAFAMLAHIFGVEPEELRRAMISLGIRFKDEPEAAMEDWLKKEDRRRRIREKYVKVTELLPIEKKRGLFGKLKEKLTKPEGGEKGEGEGE